MANREKDLEQALKDSKKAAEEGYKVAKNRLDKLSEEIQDSTKPLRGFVERSGDGNIDASSAIDDLNQQLREIGQSLNQVQTEVYQSLEEKKETLNDFSITLFGRTKSGKSTLMEILTNGDGSSIGKGAQRTTRDVRSYEWKGLKVTDVPGVAAFDGEVDERIAYQAAEQSDLIIFLITDDAPQPKEAKCFARLRKIGKPILGILNIKYGIRYPEEVQDEAGVLNESRFERFLKKKNIKDEEFTSSIQDVINQFNELIRKYSVSKYSTFKTTHLQAKFLSTLGECGDKSVQLDRASGFLRVENQIIDEVIKKGSFHTKRAYIDLITAPFIDFENKLLEFSAQNSSNGRIFVDKKNKLESWGDSYKKDGNKRINTFVNKEIEKLREYIPEFAEDHYDDKNAGKAWKKYLESAGLKAGAEELQKELYEKYQQKISDITEELEKELAYTKATFSSKSFSMGDIYDIKKYSRWGGSIAGVIGTIVLAAGWSNPVGWALIGVGAVLQLASFFFQDREARKRKARQKLSDKLQKQVDEIEERLRDNLAEWFEKKIIDGQLKSIDQDFNQIVSGIFKLADMQRKLAWKMNKQVKNLNYQLIKAALNTIKMKDELSKIKDLARIPGEALFFLIKPETEFCNDAKKQLQELLDEQIWFVIDSGDDKDLISQAIGNEVSKNEISIEDKPEKPKMVHVECDNIDHTTVTRIKLAQQLTELHIMKN